LHFALPPSENPMADHIQTGQQLANKAEKKLFCCCALFGSNYQDAAELFLKSAKSFKLGKSCSFLTLEFHLSLFKKNIFLLLFC
jgi:hypothetical protein